MIIAAELLEDLVAHAREEYDAECCGMIAYEELIPDGGGRAVSVHRAVNVFASRKRFEIDGRELLATLERFESSGWELGAIYHSHTHTAPYPSQTDINFAANWPGVEWLIVGLGGDGAPVVRSYLIEDGQVREVPVEVQAAGAPGTSGELGTPAAPQEKHRAEGQLVKVARASNQPEAEMIEALLREEGIPSLQRRAGGFDVPDFLAAGPRDIFVPESAAQAARETLEAPPGWGRAGRRSD
jgi:[CysO sulfur-carrier protein]-S-L-cysteine hydrolase